MLIGSGKSKGAKQPKPESRKSQVLLKLAAGLTPGVGLQGGWVPGEDMCTARCGGSEGLRRLRELRDDGWFIESNDEGSGCDLYRLVL